MAHHQRHSAKYFSCLTFGNRMFSLFLLDHGFPGERFGIPARAFSCIIAEASDRETSVSNGHLPLCLVFLPCSQHHTFPAGERRYTRDRRDLENVLPCFFGKEQPVVSRRAHFAPPYLWHIFTEESKAVIIESQFLVTHIVFIHFVVYLRI